MSLLIDSFWRAAMYCLLPRVIFLSVLPLVLLVGLTLTLGYFFWDAAIAQVRAWLDTYAIVQAMWQWLESLGAGQLKTVLAPILVIIGVTPLIVMASLLLVALLMAPAMVRMVATRRFPDLVALRGAGQMRSVLASLGTTAMALVALVFSIPLWAIPPLVVVIPPLIWGWLTYRVMAFDALAEHASAEERREIFQRHRITLLIMGVAAGYLGAAPSLLWASGAMFAAAFVVLAPLAVWVYMLVFAFSSLWFTHFCLSALHALRAERAPRKEPSPAEPDPLILENL